MQTDVNNLLWITDPHLNHTSTNGEVRFANNLKINRGIDPFDAIVITGDIADGDGTKLEDLLTSFANTLAPTPIYFVFGNHDSYYRSISETKAAGVYLTKTVENLHFLDTFSGPVRLTDKTALVGHTGWADGYFGNPYGNLIMSDWLLIKDLKLIPRYNLYEGQRQAVIDASRFFAKEAAAALQPNLMEALHNYDNVIIATHFPPYEGACWHKGKLSGPDYLPWFASAVMGDMIDDCSHIYPGKKITVLCGHTHSSGFYQHSENIIVETGRSEYGYPQVSAVLEVL